MTVMAHEKWHRISSRVQPTRWAGLWRGTPSWSPPGPTRFLRGRSKTAHHRPASSAAHYKMQTWPLFGLLPHGLPAPKLQAFHPLVRCTHIPSGQSGDAGLVVSKACSAAQFEPISTKAKMYSGPRQRAKPRRSPAWGLFLKKDPFPFAGGRPLKSSDVEVIFPGRGPIHFRCGHIDGMWCAVDSVLQPQRGAKRAKRGAAQPAEFLFAHDTSFRACPSSDPPKTNVVRSLRPCSGGCGCSI
jgi:hypothetical protein